MSNLPKGWASIKLGDIVGLSYGKSLPKEARNAKGKYPVYGSNGVVGYHDSFLVVGPSIIVGRKGGAGIATYAIANCWPIDTTYFISPSKVYDLKFLYYLITSLRLSRFDRSTAIPGLNRDDAYALDILLPPLKEQKNIVAKIEELFSELDKAVESLKTARAQLKVYRQAILKHAFEGKLTADWRKKSRDKDTWRKVSLEALGTVVCGQSPSVSEVNQYGKGILYVTGPEQWNGSHIEEVKWTEHPKKIAPDGSIFITVKGAGVGKLFPGKRCAIGRDIYAFCPNKLASTEFIIYALRYSIDQVVLQAKGDIPGLSKNHILDHVIGLPSPKEQTIVVQTLDRIFSNTNDLEKEILTQLQKSEALRQSILKKAFSGQLVAQDPADEPASVLLERIRAEKEGTSDKKPKTKRRAA